MNPSTECTAFRDRLDVLLHVSLTASVCSALTYMDILLSGFPPIIYNSVLLYSHVAAACVSLSVSLSLCMSLSLFLDFSLSVSTLCLSLRLSVCLSLSGMSLSLCLPVCLSVCLSFCLPLLLSLSLSLTHPTSKHTNTNAGTNTVTCTCKQVHTLARVPHTHARTHKRIHTHTNTHTHRLSGLLSPLDTCGISLNCYSQVVAPGTLPGASPFPRTQASNPQSAHCRACTEPLSSDSLTSRCSLAPASLDSAAGCCAVGDQMICRRIRFRRLRCQATLMFGRRRCKQAFGEYKLSDALPPKYECIHT